MSVYQNGEIVLYGAVGFEWPGEGGFRASDVLEALAEHGRGNDIVVRINSGGGYAYDGIAIFNALSAHKGEVHIIVDGVAASAASIIALAGAKITMRSGSLLMLHEPAVLTHGTSDDHQRAIASLDRLAEQMASIYAERSGNDLTAVRAAMRAELWLTGDEAVEQGYATEVEHSSAIAFAAFDYRLYAHAPEALTNLAHSKNWSVPGLATSSARETEGGRADRLEKELNELKASVQKTADTEAQRGQYEAERLEAHRGPRVSGRPSPRNGSHTPSRPTSWDEFITRT
ncbi:Clp protease [Aminobacter sp. Y103A]|uniref:head maturation protease, ClpP-related n=1 Tax=Aminobacter sp. Y103A TaxID=1870862 RepID=UPI002573E7BF|nr:head maturation protease, ClpP-related [Aminobacter sp. SS-2016]BBD37478.1 Clp protease [Aminobacter sp. SS-2016]